MVQHVTERGCLVVAAAGNDNSFSVGYPGAFDTVMCVGAVEVDPDTGAVTRWDETDESGRHGSNYGPDVDIAAPGRRVYSTTLNGSYFHNSGTSFATPLVAGAAAVVWSNYPEWTAQQVRERLEQTAIPLSPGEQDLGAGMVDLFEALFNGSFETGGLHGWDAHSVTGLSPNYAPWGVPVARAIGPIAGFPPPLANYYDPTPRGDINNWMAYIDNSGPDVSGTTISQSFYVQPGVEATAFSFEGYFVTDEYFEWHNVAVNYNCYNDFVEVIVRGPSGSTYPYYRWERISTFNYAPYYQGTDIDIGDPGSVGRPYDHAMPQCWACLLYTSDAADDQGLV